MFFAFDLLHQDGTVTTTLPMPTVKIEKKKLVEVADLDDVLAYKGNYMIFPLKKTNALTDFMMIPYLDAVTGIRDPDPLSNWTLSDFMKYVCFLYRKLPKSKFDELLPGLQAAYQRIFSRADADTDKIVVPTDSLFIEALPGVHPILEDFKLFHRIVDVKKVQAEVRRGAETPDFFSTRHTSELHQVLHDTPGLGIDQLVNHGAVRIDYDQRRIFRDSAVTNLTDFFQRFLDIFFGERALPAQVLERPLPFFLKIFKHR